ncbi:MAG TPA: (Fe-S)-binding protein [Bacillota bacterium]|nr:(Fe-S)-binding protein [Bacillota bacterium]HQJ36792.1 (Fe-S)-binding protein [Bacillota bacterium]
MFSEKANKHADNCRFCWMCRYICPVGLQTGKETNNARAKGLLVSLVNRGQEFDESYAGTMYECCLCGACSQDCKTGFEPPIFIREARTEAIVRDVLPENVRMIADNLMEKGNLYGVSSAEIQSKLEKLLPNRPQKAGVLLYVGQTALIKAPEISEALICLLKKASVDFTVLYSEGQSGAEIGDVIGYVAETITAAKNEAAKINTIGAEKVVVLDPNVARVMKQEYPVWGCDINAEIVTATAFIAGLIADGKLSPQKIDMKEVTFHDPCKLSRDLDETEPARYILKSMGIEIKEMFLNREWTKCCGTEIVKAHSPALGALIADGRWGDAERIGAACMVTACPGCFDVMGQCVPEGMKHYDLFILLAEACGC